jgi:hypothetical protein
MPILAQFANMCLTGRIPLDVRPVFFTELHSVPLPRKVETFDQLPSVQHRDGLLQKLHVRTQKDAVVTKLAPTQLGFGVAHDAEAAVHATRSFVANMGSGKAIMKSDFKYTLNTMLRDEMLNIVHSELPTLYPFIQVVTPVTHSCTAIISR